MYVTYGFIIETSLFAKGKDWTAEGTISSSGIPKRIEF